MEQRVRNSHIRLLNRDGIEIVKVPRDRRNTPGVLDNRVVQAGRRVRRKEQPRPVSLPRSDRAIGAGIKRTPRTKGVVPERSHHDREFPGPFGDELRGPDLSLDSSARELQDDARIKHQAATQTHIPVCTGGVTRVGQVGSTGEPLDEQVFGKHIGDPDIIDSGGHLQSVHRFAEIGADPNEKCVDRVFGHGVAANKWP